MAKPSVFENQPEYAERHIAGTPSLIYPAKKLPAA